MRFMKMSVLITVKQCCFAFYLYFVVFKLFINTEVVYCLKYYDSKLYILCLYYGTLLPKYTEVIFYNKLTNNGN